MYVYLHNPQPNFYSQDPREKETVTQNGQIKKQFARLLLLPTAILLVPH